MPIKGVWCVPYKRANGKTRYYYYTSRVDGIRFWHSDGKRIDLSKLPEEFITAYQNAKLQNKGYSPNSFASVFNRYQKKSVAFQRMKIKGQLARIRYLKMWLEMPLKGGRAASAAPLSIFDSRGIIKYITSYRDKIWGSSPSAADEAIVALSAFLTWCKEEGLIDWNRARSIRSVYTRQTKSRIWTQQEQDVFLKDAPWQLSTAFRLALFTGLRLGDLLRLPLSARREQHLIIPTSKSRGQNTAIIPIFDPLEKLLEELETKRNQFDQLSTTLLFNSRGSSWTVDGFSSSFYRHRSKCDLGDNPPSIHDLRKTAATRMVILQKSFPHSITDSVLVDMFGWTMPTLSKMKRIYVSDDEVISALSGTEHK